MKILILSLAVAFCSLWVNGQNLSDHGQSKDPQIISPLFLSSADGQVSSQTHSYVDFSAFGREGVSDKCGKYKKLKTTGIILASVGGGLLISGIALIAVGTGDAINNGGGSLNDVGLYAGGAVLIVGGVGCAGAGIPLAIIGSVKYRKHCGAGSSYMQLSTKGNSLALNF